MPEHTPAGGAEGDTEACALCEPRPRLRDEAVLIARQHCSSLYLRRDQTYRGHCMLVYDARHVRRLDELTRDEWQAASLELWIATRAIVQVFAPDHLNVESLGNVVAHLHWHLIPRYRHDPRWGKPIWLDAAADPVRLTEHEYGQLAARLAARLDPDRS